MDLGAMKHFEALVQERDRLKRDLKRLEEATDVPDEQTKTHYERFIADATKKNESAFAVIEGLQSLLVDVCEGLDNMEKAFSKGVDSKALFLKLGQIKTEVESRLGVIAQDAGMEGGM